MTKILIILLLALVWIFLIVKQAGSELTQEDIGSYSDQFIASNYVPYASKFDLTPTEDGWCVSFVQKNGFEAYRGNANEWIKYINSFTPSIGAVVVLSEGKGGIGHLALVTAFTEEGVEVYEQNYQQLGVVSHRVIDSSRVIGYVTR